MQITLDRDYTARQKAKEYGLRVRLKAVKNCVNCGKPHDAQSNMNALCSDCDALLVAETRGYY